MKPDDIMLIVYNGRDPAEVYKHFANQHRLFRGEVIHLRCENVQKWLSDLRAEKSQARSIAADERAALADQRTAEAEERARAVEEENVRLRQMLAGITNYEGGGLGMIRD